MTRRQVVVMYLAALVWTVLMLGVARAQTPDPIIAVAPMLAQSRLVVDVAGFISPSDAKALQAKLVKTSPPILIAVLPDSAVGDRLNGAAVEAAVYRLATATGVSATVGLVLPQSGYFRATSNVLSTDTVDAMAMQSARATNQVGVAQEVSDFIIHVQMLSAGPAAPEPAPEPSRSVVGQDLLIATIVAVGFWAVCMWGIRRHRSAKEQTGRQG